MDILERCMDQLATKFLANRNANLKRGERKPALTMKTPAHSTLTFNIEILQL